MSDDNARIWTMLGKRWTLSILKIVGTKEPIRFCEIKRAIAGISSTMLSERLVELEQEGLVTKNLRGSKIEYRLTAGARELGFMLTKLDRWWYVYRRTHQPAVAVYQ